jgi:hypothetical protein
MRLRKVSGRAGYQSSSTSMELIVAPEWVSMHAMNSLEMA